MSDNPSTPNLSTIKKSQTPDFIVTIVNEEEQGRQLESYSHTTLTHWKLWTDRYRFSIILKHAQTNEVIYLDPCCDYVKNGNILLESDLLLKDRRKQNGIYISSEQIETLYKVLKKSIKESFKSDQYETIRSEMLITILAWMH